MQPLCSALNITVNDLLSGEKVSETDYQQKAEENRMNLMRENEENKKRMALSVVCGVITIIAVCRGAGNQSRNIGFQFFARSFRCIHLFSALLIC